MITYDLTRLQRLPTETRYLVTLGGEHLVDPDLVIDRMEYEHPLYNPTSVAAQRRLPELDTDRIAFAGAYHGWGFHEDGARSGLAAAEHLGLAWPAEWFRGSLRSHLDHRRDVPARLYDVTIRHTRRKPFRRTFTHRSQMWLVDLDDLPDHGVLGRFEARDHLDIHAFLAEHDIDVAGGRVLMAANARAFGYCFNPISVFWCWDAAGDLAATVVEVHNTYGDRHAYLVHPDEQGRATVAEGDVRLAVPRHRRHLRAGRAGARRPPRHRGHAAHRRRGPVQRVAVRPPLDAPVRSGPPRRPLRGALLIRLHGIWLWLRRLPVRPRPRPRHRTRQERVEMTTTANRVSANYWPGLDELPTGPQAAIAARIARRLFRAAVSRLDVTVVIGEETLGRGGPVAVIHRPDEFFARIGRDQLIGFGEAYLTGAWDAEDLGGFLTVLCSEIQHLVPRNLQKLRSLVVARPPRWQKSNAKNAQGNIAHHYDLSNDLFELFLDPTLSYSSASLRRPGDGDARPTSSPPRAARSSACSTRPASARAPGCSRSAPAGASSRSGPPAAAPPSARSRCRWSRSCSPRSGSPRPAVPTW